MKKTVMTAAAALMLALSACSGGSSTSDPTDLSDEQLQAELDALRPDSEGLAQLETDCTDGDLQACDNLLWWTQDPAQMDTATTCGGNEPEEGALVYCTVDGPEMLTNPLFEELMNRLDEQLTQP